MITIISSPAALHGHKDAVFEVQTTRVAAVPVRYVSALANSGGKLAITTTVAHTLESGDIVKLGNFTGLPQQRTRITVLSTTQIKCEDIAYSSSIAHSGGTVEKANQRVKIRCEVKQGSTTLATLENWSHSSGVFYFGLEAVLERALLGQVSATIPSGSGVVVSGSASVASIGYICTFSEWMDDYRGIPSAVVAAGATATSSGVIATYFDVEGFASYQCTASTTGKWLVNEITQYQREDETTRWELLCNTAATVRVVRNFTDGSSATTDYAVTPSAGRVVVYLYAGLFTSTLRSITLRLLIGGNVRSDTLTVVRQASAKKKSTLLQWVNEFGAMQHMYTVDYQESYDVERTTGWVGELAAAGKAVRKKTISIPMLLDDATAGLITGIVISQRVWFDGKQCVVVNSSLPKVTRGMQEYSIDLQTTRK